MAERIIAGLRVNVVHPGVYRVSGTFLYLSYLRDKELQGWWITHFGTPQHRKPYQSMTEACTILKTIVHG